MSPNKITRISVDRGSGASILGVHRKDGSFRIYPSDEHGYWEGKLFDAAKRNILMIPSMRLVDPYSITRRTDGGMVFRRRVGPPGSGGGHIAVVFQRSLSLDVVLGMVQTTESIIRATRADLVEWAYTRQAIEQVAHMHVTETLLHELIPVLMAIPGLTEKSYMGGSSFSFDTALRCMLYTYLIDVLNVREGV